MNPWDVVVVGGGPAGSAAAYDLAESGFGTLVLDRRSFPREKACAGGLTVKALNSLRYSVAPILKQLCSDVRFALETERSVVTRSPRPLVAMTIRSELDAFCLEKTRAAGADFKKIRSIRGVVETDEEVRLETDEGEIRARFLIGADGASSTIRRLVWPSRSGSTNGFALEARLDLERPGDYLMEFDFGVVPGGYGWVFPKGDHLNVGVYSYLPRVPIDRGVLSDFVERRFGSALTTECTHVIGSPIGLVALQDWPVTQRVTLAGDAAQVVDPLLGEGIYYAIRSGQEAAAAAVDALQARDSFSRGMERRGAAIRRDLKTNWRAARLFYSRLGHGYRVLSLAAVRNFLTAGCSKGWTISETKNRILTAPFIRGTWPEYLEDPPRGW